MRRSKRKLDDGRGGKVSAVVLCPEDYDPARTPLLLLAHGAGAGMGHPFMVEMQKRLAERGIAVVLFNFPFKERGGRAPDTAKVLEGCYRAVADQIRSDSKLQPRRLILGGKSMGGRIASQIVAAGYPASGLLFLGYPLHPAGKPDRMRTAHLPEIAVDMLFIQGTRDALCDIADLRVVIAGLKAPIELHVVEGGDHSFKVLKRDGRSEDSVFTELTAVSCVWLEQL